MSPLYKLGPAAKLVQSPVVYSVTKQSSYLLFQFKLMIYIAMHFFVYDQNCKNASSSSTTTTSTEKENICFKTIKLNENILRIYFFAKKSLEKELFSSENFFWILFSFFHSNTLCLY
jgi:hypothetical protein